MCTFLIRGQFKSPWCLALFTTAKCSNAMLVIITRFASIIAMHYLNIVIISRTAPILVSVLVLDQYQHFLIVSESIKYAIQVLILLHVINHEEIVFFKVFKLK